ncbi:hypothetical protein CspHIS471_0410860 [Cutaneotrichosporon sp. HIS471]|nr:hypothetical protein CspHIS471_0410860 [Cutaneotrichosporon sp. HIS471]
MVYFQPGPRLHLLLDALAFVPVHLFILPATALYHGIRYWLAPSARRFPRLTWWRYIVLNLQRIEGAGHSDFVSMDRPGWMGWSWGVVRNDFEDFWYATAE